MKPQDFMEALGGVSQEKLDALAKWQEAGTPITGKAPAQEKRIMQTAAEPVPTQRRRETMKQKVKTKASAAQFLPWKIGVGAAVAACAAIAVSIGAGIISMDKQQQMQVGMSGETSVAEQISKQETNEEKTNHEPVPLIEKIYASIGTNETAPEISGNGLVEVWRSMDDAAEFIEYDQIGKLLDCSKHFTEALFAEYDVLYIAFPYDEKLMPITTFRYQLSGGEFDADGKIHLTTGALVLDELPNCWAIDQPRFHSTNEYWFYTVPKDSLPDIHAWEIETDEYHIGELDETAKDAANGDDAINQFIKTTDAYQKWDAAVNRELYITWEDNIPIPPEDCTEIQGAAEKQETADEKRVEIAGVTEFCSPVGIADEACFLVRSEADYQAMTALYPNIDCGFAESDDYDALFLLIPTEDADTYVSVTGITVSEATGRISLFIADDSSAYRDLETFTATKIVRLYIEKDALLPEFSGEFPQKVGMNVTWDYENTYDDFSAFCEAYPAATYIEVVS